MIDEMLLHRLRRASAMLRRTPENDPKGMPHKCGYGHVLKCLTEQNGLSQQALANAVGIRPQTISEALISLESASLITRTPSPSDARVMLVFITEFGRQRAAELAEERRQRAMAFFAPLTADEKETLYSLLHKLTEEKS